MMPAYKSFHLPQSYHHYSPQRDFHTEHIKLEIELDFEKKTLSGRCTLKLRPLRSGTKHVALNACDMQIAGVMCDGKKCDYDYDGERLTLKPEGGFNGGSVVSVDYSTNPKEGVTFVGPEPAFPQKEIQAWSHGEAEYSRYWFPCYDFPDDRSSTEIEVTVPKDFRVVSNGELLDVRRDGTKSTFRWKEDHPYSTYLVSFVAGKLGELKQESEGVPLYYYFPEYKRADVLRYFGETPAMLKVFNEVTGVAYPYAKYAQTTVEDFIFGGMENLNATTLAMTYYPDEASEEDFQTSYSLVTYNAVNLVAHELAHQWFGDLVTCADWSHAWLNEGWATYMQGLYLERSKGVDEFRWDMSMRAEEYFEEDKESYRRPIVEKDYIHPDDIFDYTTYEKGEWMIHELRYILGDELFFKGVKEYLTTHAWQNVETVDFRRAMSKTSGYPLEEFFEQAFFKPGFPEFEVNYAWEEGSMTATVSVKQVQNLEGGTPLFKLPCDLVFYNRDGRQKKRVKVEGREQSFSFELREAPSIVEFDPEHWLLKKVKFKKSPQLLRNQLNGSKDASSRSEAAKELGELKSNSEISSLADAAKSDSFWEVRASAIKAIGQVGTPEALKALLAIGLPDHRRVRRAVVAALGNFKDDNAKAVVIKSLESDSSPYVRCEAALSLGKSWPDEALPHLKKWMGFKSPNETMTEACLEAMGKLREVEAEGIVRQHLAYEKPARARIGALKAIKARGYFRQDEIQIMKDILLKDKAFRVRLFLAATVIPEIGDGRLLDTLLESSKTDKDMRIRRRALEAYYAISGRTETTLAVVRLKEEVESLKKQNAEHYPASP